MAQPYRRRLRWSTPVEDVVRQVVADRPVACWFEPAGLVRTAPRTHLLLLPLRDVAVPGLDREPLPGVGPEHWLVWQSLTSTGRPTLLPTDPARLARGLGLGGGLGIGLGGRGVGRGQARGARVVEAALRELMAAIYESRSV